MPLFYSVVLAGALLVGAPWWLLAMFRHGKYRAGFWERWGFVPSRLSAAPTSSATAATPNSDSCIWMHAVSVGEVLAATGLIEELRRQRQGRVVISTTTMTGQNLARDRFGAANVFYFPLDFAFAIRPYLRRLRPELLILVETEFWPNLLRLAHAQGTRIAVVNARVSDRSFPRYRRFRWLMRSVLATIDVYLAQTEEDARRLAAIGADAGRVRVCGNLKFDLRPPAASPLVASLRAGLERTGVGPVIVAGSTVEGEEPEILQAFKRVLERWPQAVLLLAPRHPERFASVAGLLAASGLKWWRRSQWTGAPVSGGIFLLDSIGELGAAYELAQVAFVGGSLAPRGGHNILEPAFYGAPIIVGPHMENFRDVLALFAKQDAVRVVANGEELSSLLLHLLADERERADLGAKAAAVLRCHSGATARTAEIVQALVSTQPRAWEAPR
jgi:3-deoxy-D-manno-octulosonic-acid transferase